MNILQRINPKPMASKIVMLSTALFLFGCNSDSTTTMVIPPAPEPVIYKYEVSVTNLTAAQPLSPVAVLLHNDGMLWTIGSAASDALEHLAESGDNSMVLADTMAIASSSGEGVIMPGASETITVAIADTQPMYLSAATMLVNTNDAFSGINAVDISSLAVGDAMDFMTPTYDAGTEKNTETMATIPGPAAGGEGYNSERMDSNMVTMHSGVVSKDDGLATSVLTAAHRFDNPTLSVTITRIE